MLNMKTLRGVLQDILGVDDKHLLPINENQFVPTVNKEDKVGTFVGYRILEKVMGLRAYSGAQYYIASSAEVGQSFYTEVECKFRISFIGPQAEELADQTLLWDVRSDVRTAFEKVGVQVNYTKRRLFTYPVREGGFNDNMCWVVDFYVRTAYEVSTKWPVWQAIGG